MANVGETIRSVDPNLPVVSLKTFVEHRDTGFEVWFIRMAAKVFAVFGFVAMAVAMVGVYGVRAIMVGRRAPARPGDAGGVLRTGPPRRRRRAGDGLEERVGSWIPGPCR